MLRDAWVLVRLKARHGWTALCRAMHLVGADPSVDRDVLDRLYYLYLVAALVGYAVVLWALVLSVAVPAVAQLGAAAVLVPRLYGAVVALAAGAASVTALRRSPLKLTEPDVALVATGPLRLEVVALVWLVPGAVLCAVAGGAVGYLVGAGVQAAGEAVDLPGMVLCAALLAACAGAAPWVVGVVRLARRRISLRAGARRVACVVAGVLVAAAAVLCAAFSLTAPDVFLGRATSLAAAPLLLDVFAAECALVLAFGRRMDATRLVGENALFAQLSKFTATASLFDATNARAYRRRCKVAARRPWLGLPAAEGPAAVVARSALSCARQPEGLPALLRLGFAFVPLGVLACGQVGGVGLLLVWVMAVLLAADDVRELGRAFRDDVRLRLVRDRLPFGTLALLACNALAPGAVVAVLAAATSALAAVALAHSTALLGELAASATAGGGLGTLFGGVSAGAAVPDPALAALTALTITAALVLCCGWDAVALPRGRRGAGPSHVRRAASFEQGFVLLAVLVFLLIACGMPVPLAVAVACVPLVWAARAGVEV